MEIERDNNIITNNHVVKKQKSGGNSTVKSQANGPLLPPNRGNETGATTESTDNKA